MLKCMMMFCYIMMMVLGGVIGVGLFKGSSLVIDVVGLFVIIVYLFGGIILLFIM